MNLGFPSTTSRRNLLKALGVGAATAAVRGAWAADSAASSPACSLRERARKNLKLGIFTNVYADLPLEEAARQIRKDGFGGVVTDFAFKDVRLDPLNPDEDAVKKIRACLRRHGIEVVGLMGYYNVIDPDASRRKLGEQRMDYLIRNWKQLGCPIISTETGTLNARSEWAESPENETERGYQLCRAAMEKLARAAEKTGAVIAIETYWRNIISTIERTERLFRDVASPSLKLTMDPCNYFRNEDLPKMRPMLEDMFARVGRQTVLAHAKDVKRAPDGPELPAAGLGELDYSLYLRLLTKLDREYWLVLEHLTRPDVARARDYVRGRMDVL